MVNFDIPINRKQNSAYIPKTLTREFGYEVRITPDTRAALLYPRDATITDLLRSLEHLRAHFETLAGENSR